MAKIEEVFKLDDHIVSIDFGSIIDDDDFTIEKILPNDNLMAISYRLYGTVDRWWVLYFFNRLQTVDTCIIDNNRMKEYMKEIDKKLSRPTLLTDIEKMKYEELFRYILLDRNTPEKAIELSKKIVSGEKPYKEYLSELELLISTEIQLTTDIKVPSERVAYSMVAYLDDYIKNHSQRK